MRFQPDTLAEALLRPLAMAAADANVYVEIMAPDFRFLLVLGLLAALGAMTLLRRRRAPGDGGAAGARPVAILLATLAAAFVPWLATTGNGRYFVAGLLLVGPVCVGLVRLLPVTRAMQLTLALGCVALQGFAIQQSAPWRAWQLAAWQEPPYFHLDLPPELRAQPATFVTMSAISYSLVAPQFHPASRWINLHNAGVPGSAAWSAPGTEAFLSAPHVGRMLLFVPAVAGMQTQERLPNAAISASIERELGAFGLAFAAPRTCRFLHSRGLAQVGLGDKTPEEIARSGFWLCELRRLPAGAQPETSRGHRHDAVFRILETQCPRFFPAGGDGASLKLPDGEVRSYLQAEMKVYVYDSGAVYYKYYRALNPVPVGRAEDLLAGRTQLDCSRIRGRSGLPWEREI